MYADKMRRLAHMLIDAGFDVVHGVGPHPLGGFSPLSFFLSLSLLRQLLYYSYWLPGIECYKRRPILYGAGDFVGPFPCCFERTGILIPLLFFPLASLFHLIDETRSGIHFSAAWTTHRNPVSALPSRSDPHPHTRLPRGSPAANRSGLERLLQPTDGSIRGAASLCVFKRRSRKLVTCVLRN
jgi:hypothetical protein